MRNVSRRGGILAVAALVLVTGSACATAGSSSRATGSPSASSAPASPLPTATPVDGVVRIETRDTLRFSPARVAVAGGSAVRFVVVNGSKSPHEFIVGDESVQQQHEKQMSSGMSMSGMHMDEGLLAALSIPAGETKTVTITFPHKGELRFGCHVPGHYGAGMFGIITVR